MCRYLWNTYDADDVPDEGQTENKKFKQLCTNIEAFSTSAIFKIASRRIDKVSYRVKNLRTVIRLMKRVKNDDGRVLGQFVCLVFGERRQFVDPLEKRSVLEEETAGRVAAAVFTHINTPSPRRPPLDDSCCPKHTPAAF